MPRFEVSAVCDIGKVRSENQDAILVREDAGLFAVADGMGGGMDGALASRWVCDALGEAESAAQLDAAIARANDRIRYYAQARRYRMMGSTLALVAAGNFAPAGQALVGWIGDSRVYLHSGGEMRLLTRDHTVRNAIAGGELPPSQRSVLSAQPSLLSLLTRAIGMETEIRMDSCLVELLPGDRLLICSDGVHGMLGAEELGALLGGDDPVLAISAAVRARGAADNFSMIVLSCA